MTAHTAADADKVPLLVTQGLGRTTEDGLSTLLQPTDYQLRAGDRVSITGASASGKSVFLRLLALLDTATVGTLRWQGQPLANTQIPRYRSQVCYLPQRPALLDGDVQANLRAPFALQALRHLQYDEAKVIALLAQAGKQPGFLRQQAADLSGGEAQILALVRVLQLQPQVLLLDEPTAALDAASAQAVETLIDAWSRTDSAQPRAYIWVSHDLAQAQRMGRIRLHMVAGHLTEAAQP